jgi:hypothetical protein
MKCLIDYQAFGVSLERVVCNYKAPSANRAGDAGYDGNKISSVLLLNPRMRLLKLYMHFC